MHLIRDFKTMDRKNKVITLSIFALMTFFIVSSILGMPLADGTKTIKDVLEKMINVVNLVFQAVGVLLSVYSVGQLVLAFKNEDADSKSRASTMLVVGVALIAIPEILKSLDLLNQLTATI